MEYPIITGSKLVSNPDVNKHLRRMDYSPYVENVIMKPGLAEKRFGYDVIYSWDTGDEIMGFFRVDSTHAIIAINDNSANATILYEYNCSAVSPTFTLLTGITNSFSQDYYWHFTWHFDSVNSGTDNRGIIICGNGYDGLVAYDAYSTGDKLGWLITSPPTGYAEINGSYYASYNGVLYLASMYEYDGATTTYLPYRIGISKPDDAGTWDYKTGGTYDFETRPEGGASDNITGIVVFKQSIVMLFKESSVWPITPYLSFGPPLYSNRGLSSEFGYVVTDDTILFNHQGMIYDLANNWLSYDIHNLMAGSGDISSITGCADNFLDRYIFSTGKALFLREKSKDNWTQWLYGSNVELLSTLPPYRATEEYTGDIEKHNYMSVDEETIMPDFLIKYNNRHLCTMNHYCEDDGKAIRFMYDTPSVSADAQSRRKRWTNIKLQGTPNATVSVYFKTHDMPLRNMPEYGAPVTCTLNSDGYGQANIDDVGVYIAIRVVENSKDPFYLASIIPEFTMRESLI